MKPVVYFVGVTLLRQNIQVQSPGQGDSLVMSCLAVNFFQNYYLEIFDPFLKCTGGISAHRASVRTWSTITKTLLWLKKPQPTSPHDCGSLRRILWWTTRSHSASMLGIHVDPIRRKDSSWRGVVIEGTLFDIICVYVPPVLSNSNFHDYFQLDLMWI